MCWACEAHVYAREWNLLVRVAYLAHNSGIFATFGFLQWVPVDGASLLAVGYFLL